MAVVTVEAVSGRAAFRRFFEFAYLQFREEPRWSPPVVAYERTRLDPRRNPFFEQGDGEYFLARRGGVVAGRITAHMAAPDDTDGWFGFFDVADDEDVARALLDKAESWLRERGCTSMAGPASFTPADEPGVLVRGFDVAGTTGRPWHPPWYANHLEGAGFVREEEQHSWRLESVDGPVVSSAEETAPTRAGRFTDPRLVLDNIVAVPDLTPARGSATTLARRSRRRDWEGCTIVHLDGDPRVLVPRMQTAAGAAGYRWVISPWSPEPTAQPETTHARFTRTL